MPKLITVAPAEREAAKVALFKADIIGRLEDAVTTLHNLAKTGDAARLNAKAASVQTILDDQRERFLAVNSWDDIMNLAVLIHATNEHKWQDPAGTSLVISYMREYIH